MGRPRNREEALEALRASLAKGKIIVGAGAGKWAPHPFFLPPCSLYCCPRCRGRKIKKEGQEKASVCAHAPGLEKPTEGTLDCLDFLVDNP